MLKKIATSFMIIAFASAGLFAQTVTGPAAKDTVKAAPDYATEVQRDRMDMNQRTDLGYRVYNGVAPISTEQPPSYLTNPAFAGGLFTAVTVFAPGVRPDYSADNIYILDSTYPGVDPAGNKFGALFPINADKYKYFAIRIYLQPNIEGDPQSKLLWSKDTIYNTALTPNGGQTISNLFPAYNNWAIQIIDIPSLGILPLAGYRNDPWSGLVDSLRFDPIVFKDKEIKIDWIRLVEGGAVYQRTITWTGFAGNVDIYLDDDADAGNGILGQLARNVSGTSYTFLAGALAAGNYYVAVAPTGTTNYAYSAGYYEVTQQPIVDFTKPTAEGSDQDYVSAVWTDPWDMANAQDIERTDNVENGQFIPLNVQDLNGNPFNNATVFYGTAAPAAPGNVGDPIVRFIHFWPATLRGATRPIDTSKYHNLVFSMGIAGASSPNDGSIARVAWKLNSETVENVAKAFVVRHAGDRWVRQTFVRDLRKIELETGAASPSHAGWTGMVDSFRIDPHEFSDLRAFFFDDVKITADWTADASFPVTWNLDDADGNPVVALYYDTDDAGFDGVLIAANLAGGAKSYNWDTSGVPAGTYWLYAVVNDGLNENRAYAGGPVVIRHAAGGTPTIGVSRNRLNFGAVRGGPITAAQNVVVSNTGTGTLNWTATTTANWIKVAPASGVNTGTLAVSVDPSGLPGENYFGCVCIVDPNATNTPMAINVYLTIYGGGTNPPFGVVETPPNGQSGIEGSVAVTGWVLDDVGVDAVKIYREPVGGEPAGPNGLVYIGDAVFVEGARPDVEQAYPALPWNYRAGWGYMMLTNFLPNQGNGTFQIYAIAQDREGHLVVLDSRTITCNNAGAVLPFGAIDTPTQGGEASGSDFVNFGWALTPLPKRIPVDGSTILVWIDGLPRGNPVYNNYRSDIATLFPTYLNSQAAVGYFYIDTTTYTNAVHTIAWSVQDSGGVGNGIGSRYFSILNTGVSSAGAAELERGGSRFGLSGARGFHKAGDLAGLAADRTLPVGVKRGFNPEARAETVVPASDGVVRTEVPALGRIEVSLDGLPAERYEAYQVVGGELRPLPIGSTFDGRRGILAWQPGPGFLGEFKFIFVAHPSAGRAVRKAVNILIKS